MPTAQMPSIRSQFDHIIRHSPGAALALVITTLITGCGNHDRQIQHAEKTMNAVQTSEGGGSSSPLQKWCSDCHAPPMPTSHKAQEWPNVVARMQNHRITEGLAKIDDQSLGKLLEYLQNHAQP